MRLVDAALESDVLDSELSESVHQDSELLLDLCHAVDCYMSSASDIDLLDEGATLKSLSKPPRSRVPIRPEVRYTGKCVAGQLIVTRSDSRETRFLPTRTDLKCYSIGFEWANCSHGTYQLALALLADVADENTAILIHEEFAKKEIAKFPFERWAFTNREIRAKIEEILLESF